MASLTVNKIVRSERIPRLLFENLQLALLLKMFCMVKEDAAACMPAPWSPPLALKEDVAKWILLKVMFEPKIMAPVFIRRTKFSAPEVPIVPLQLDKNIALTGLPAI